MAASRSACCARLAFSLFNLTNLLGRPAGVSTRYSSRLPFHERRVSGALVKFPQCRLFGVCCGISTFDEIGFFKAIHESRPAHPSVRRFTWFPLDASASRQPSLYQGISDQVAAEYMERLVAALSGCCACSGSSSRPLT
jgi:hypothetical protein